MNVRERLVALLKNSGTISDREVEEIAVAADLIMSGDTPEHLKALTRIESLLRPRFDPGSHAYLVGHGVMDSYAPSQDPSPWSEEIEIRMDQTRALVVVPRFIRATGPPGAMVELIVVGEANFPTHWPASELDEWTPITPKYAERQWRRGDPYAVMVSFRGPTKGPVRVEIAAAVVEQTRVDPGGLRRLQEQPRW